MTSRKHTWTPAQVTTLLQEYRHHIGNGKAAGSGLKMTEWTAITTSFNKTYKTSATEQTLKNKLQVEKQRYNLCVQLANKSGWGFNYEICAPTNNPGVVSDYLKLQDKAKAAKARDVITNGVPNFDLLKELFGHSIPSGNNARSSTQTSAPRSSPRRQSKGTASTIRDEDEDSEDGGDKGADEGDVDDEGDQDAVSAAGDEGDDEEFDPMPPLPTINSSGSRTSKPTSTASLASTSVASSAASATSAASARKRSRSPSNSTNFGEQPKRNHKVPAPKTALDGVSDQLERALNQLDSIGNLDTVSPSIRLPEGVQLTVVVAKKLDELLTRLNGVHDGLMCDWLLPKLTYKYAKAFSDPHLAAMFLGTSNEAALVGFLEDVFKSMQ